MNDRAVPTRSLRPFYRLLFLGACLQRALTAPERARLRWLALRDADAEYITGCRAAELIEEDPTHVHDT